MKTLQFKCALISDIIINQRAATEGNQETLDFIPGNTFLGVVAGSLYQEKKEDSFLIFHSGKVRFGDAHPLIDGQRSLKTPASWYFEKNKTTHDSLFMHHGLPEEGLMKNNNPIQLKQSREGFIVKEDNETVTEVIIEKNFAIKSAYDSVKRRSEDKKMFGYQSLQAGSVWGFEVDLFDEAEVIEEAIINALSGIKQIGRSSTAQYGLVEIEQLKKEFNLAFKSMVQLKYREQETNLDKDSLLIYAESRLIFLDDFGQPTFKPSINQLGLRGGKIIWEKSQIRTFQYASYNNTRRSRDADRCGIEKGSVFCVAEVSLDEVNKGNFKITVGSYLNEGFGKVILNPEFLLYKDQDGRAKFKIREEKVNSALPQNENEIIKLPGDQIILDYLYNQQKLKVSQNKLLERVNDFVKEHSNDFLGDRFASQWGTIRSIAAQNQDCNKLYELLFFEKPKSKEKKNTSFNEGYLVHGVAKDKWEERGRINFLKNFLKQFEGNDNSASIALVNLAAEMAKKSRKDQL